MYKSLRTAPFRRSLSATKGLLTSQRPASGAEDKLGDEIGEDSLISSWCYVLRIDYKLKMMLLFAESGIQRIETLTRRVSRDIKLGRDEVATRLLPQMGSQDRPATVIYCNYLLNSCARARNLNVSIIFQYVSKTSSNFRSRVLTLKFEPYFQACILICRIQKNHQSLARLTPVDSRFFNTWTSFQYLNLTMFIYDAIHVE